MKYEAIEPFWERPSRWVKNFEYGNMSIAWYLNLNVFRHPFKPAIIYYGNKINCQELRTLVFKAAGGLKNLGVQKGDRVYLGLQNCPQFIISYYACMSIGAILIAGSPMYKKGEMSYILKDSGTKVAILEEDNYLIYQQIDEELPVENIIVTSLTEYLPEEPEIPVPPDMIIENVDYSNIVDWKDFINSEAIEHMEELDIKKDVAVLQYTSGTTGFPKGAMLTHHNLLTNAYNVCGWVGGNTESVYGCVVPIFHINGQENNMNGPILAGSTLVLFTRWDTEVFFKATELYKISHWVAITTINLAVINHPDVDKYDLSTWQGMATGGAAVPGELVKRYVDKFGHTLYEAWGMSETCAGVTGNEIGYIKEDSCGLPGWIDVRIADMEDNTQNVPLGEEGELWVRGAPIAREYWNQPPEIQASTFKEEGWLATGDIAKMDEDGYIFVVGRIKEMIKASGYAVFPAEVEKYLYQHPAIAECCVIGVPHETKGEEVKAYIILKHDWKNKITEQEIMDWSREQMAVYKYPRIIEFRDDLPKNATGKIMRRTLKEELGLKY